VRCLGVKYLLVCGALASALLILVFPSLSFLAAAHPPRAGLSQKVVRRIIEAGPERIVYVSCNPTTLAPNAAQLVEAGRFGYMVALQSDACTQVPLAEVAGKNRLVPADDALLRAARGTGVVLGD
jgi:hypothetical protein